MGYQKLRGMAREGQDMSQNLGASSPAEYGHWQQEGEQRLCLSPLAQLVSSKAAVKLYGMGVKGAETIPVQTDGPIRTLPCSTSFNLVL